MSVIRDRFNGASAFQPRKVNDRGELVAVLWGFNGASAFQPRKGQALVAVLRQDIGLQWGLGFSAEESYYLAPNRYQCTRASMGPRLFSRGKPRILDDDAENFNTLQWGLGFSAEESPESLMTMRKTLTRFNGASAFQPRKASQGELHRCWAWWLQWGLGFSAEERCHAENKRSCDARASMGPRLFSRGKAVSVGRKSQLPLRFNGASAFQPRKAEITQAGRLPMSSFNGASAFQPRKDPSFLPSWPTSEVLQWGLGFSAEESYATQAPRLYDSRGFNGASAFQPRKASPWNHIGDGFKLASMGPRLFSRGKHDHRPNTALSEPSFNGASAFQPRKGDYQHEAAICACSFNGASAFQPRKGPAFQFLF